MENKDRDVGEETLVPGIAPNRYGGTGDAMSKFSREHPAEKVKVTIPFNSYSFLSAVHYVLNTLNYKR